MNKKNDKFTFAEPSDEMFAKFEATDYPYSNHLLPQDANFVDRVKYEFCRNLLSLKKEQNLSNQELARVLAVDLKKIKQIACCQYDKFTFDELYSYKEKIAELTQSKIVDNYSSFIVANQYYSPSHLLQIN